MFLIPLASVPKQRIAVNQDNVFWELFIYQAVGEMAYDLVQNGTTIISGGRATAPYGLMPYDYMWNSPAAPTGNFIFTTDPDWTNFSTNGSCQLYYLTNAEYQQWLTILATT